jgi:mannitol/fructose-specific phosphotransferase system IIA component
MLAREEKFTTFIGNGVAIPHGENAVKDSIIASGIVVVQYPNGVDFGSGNMAKLVIGIAGKGNEHLQILSNVAEAIEEEELLRQMLQTKNPDEIYAIFAAEGMLAQ